jgi:acylphosphatase
LSHAVHVRVTGIVQGVGYRYWTEQAARARGLSGWVRNRRDGSVEAVIAGPDDAVDEMLKAFRAGPPSSEVEDVIVEPAETPEAGFRTLPTE